MKLAATLARSLQADMQSELRAIERAVATGTREAGPALRTSCAGRSEAPVWASASPTAGGTSTRNQKLDAASVVYTKAPQIIRSFRRGRSHSEQAWALLCVAPAIVSAAAFGYPLNAHTGRSGIALGLLGDVP
jgi:hypothetical protein